MIVGVPFVHSREPTVPLAHGRSDVASSAVENALEVVCTDSNVGLYRKDRLDMNAVFEHKSKLTEAS